MSDSPYQWVQYYQQQPTTRSPVPSGGGVERLSDSTTTSMVATSVISNNSSAMVGGHLNPQGTAKPIRRRPRVSRRTPTTLLNVSPANFRSLVQQFTGCHTTSTAAPSGTRKGPLNMNFGLSNDQNDHLTTTSSIISPSGFSYNYNQHAPILHQQQQEQEQEQQQQQQYGELLSSFNNNIDHRATMQNSLPDFDMENNVPQHEFVEESALTGNTNDGYFY